MTKWFDTNYHYIVPEFAPDTALQLHPERLLVQLREAQALGIEPKVVLLGPVSYLCLGKQRTQFDRLRLLPPLLSVYSELLSLLSGEGVEWVQFDEPLLSTELSSGVARAHAEAYEVLADAGPRLLLATYFGAVAENTSLLASLPVHGVHLDAVSDKRAAQRVLSSLAPTSVVSLGVVDGRNVWKADLDAALDFLEPIHRSRGENLWIAPSCSLLHVPLDLGVEARLFAKQKIEEIWVLGRALGEGRAAVSEQLHEQRQLLLSRKNSARVSGGVQDETQIHTHMCYAEFNDIIEHVAALDADVITIETSRSNMELLEAFESFAYPNELGPGVYDIHSPNVPSEDQIVALMRRAAECVAVERLWVNPDCGLKTRRYEEVLPALRNMVAAARRLREGRNPMQAGKRAPVRHGFPRT